jgi:hypothetical protein
VAEAKKFVAPKNTSDGQGVAGEDHAKPSAANPLPSVLGGDSSSSGKAGDARCEGAHPLDDVEARDASCRCPVDVEVLEVSKDEVES